MISFVSLPHFLFSLVVRTLDLSTVQFDWSKHGEIYDLCGGPDGLIEMYVT